MRRRSWFKRQGQRLAVGLVAGAALVVGACAPPEKSSTAPEISLEEILDLDLPVASVDSMETAEDLDYAGLELLFPEIVQLEIWYREALEAVWNDDFGIADTRSAVLDSALAEVNDDLDPLASVYYQSLGARLERLKDLMLEQRTLVRYLTQVDSLSVISPEGLVDSLALANLLERRVRPRPDSPRYDLALVENFLTERWVRYFTGDGRRYMNLWLSRVTRYDELIYEMLDEHNVPRDLIYLALIESGLSMKARSRANAVGPWQFIASTGRIYDLKINWWIDERRSLDKATHAAARHLSDLYESFESWPLAMAAYNCGARRVERAIRRHGTRDFWQLTSLPRQTRNYVPKFMAALYIGTNPDQYNFKVEKQDLLKYEVVTVDDATDLRLLADLAGCDLKTLGELNPHLKRWCTPPGEQYEVKVPKGSGKETTEKLAQVPQEDRVTWRRHRVKRGDTLSQLARKYGTSVGAIRSANNLRSKSLIRRGAYLVIPVVSVESPGPRARQAIAEAAKVAKTSSDGTTQRLTYRVRRGDTLTHIGRRHGVSVRQIMQWNKKRSSRIYVGERLRIYVRTRAD